VSHRIRRRAFLKAAARGTIGASLLPLAGCSRGAQAPARTANDGRWAPLVADIERRIPGLMAAAVVPGLSIAIVRDGRLLWHQGFGVRDSASNEPVDDGTVFEAQSMSKPVFAYAVMQLYERGAIDLDAPLTTYGSRRPLEGDPRLDSITARHVLCHSAGFQNWRSSSDPLRIHFTPGERHLYSGEGYHYLQSVVTELTGRVDPEACGRYEGDVEICATDIDAYLTANVLAPFGMRSSGYVWNDGRFRNHARPHDVQGRPGLKGRPTPIDAARYAAAGALQTTAVDYARFLIAVVDPKKGDRFHLRRGTIAEMVRPHVKVGESSSWALGWAVQHTGHGDVIFHAGDERGFHSIAVASVPAKSGFVIMTNGDNGKALIGKLMVDDALQPFLLSAEERPPAGPMA